MDEESLRDGAKHVRYEVDMLLATTRYISDPPADVSWVEYNAMVESFGIHARNLRDFLGKAKPRKDDIAATDYSPSWAREWIEGLGHVDKQIAHLTTKRLNKQNMDFSLTPKLVAAFERFYRGLPSDRRAWFD